MWSRVKGFLSQQKDDAVDGTKFVTENLKGNNPSAKPTRRQFMKGLGTAGVTGYIAVEGAQNVFDPLQVSYGDSNSDNGGRPQDDSGNDHSGNGNGGTPDDTGNDNISEGEVEDIYEVLGDSGDSDIEIMEDWLEDGYERGYDVDDVVVGQDSSGDTYLAFSENGDAEMPLKLRESHGYSDSEVEAIEQYAEEGVLDEVLEPATE